MPKYNKFYAWGLQPSLYPAKLYLNQPTRQNIMTTYSQRRQLETKAQSLAKQANFWQGIENTCLVALGMVALGLLISAYFGM